MPVHIYGGSGADTLLGDAGANDIHGRGGNDLIYGDGLNGPRPPIFPEPFPGPVIRANWIGGGAGNDTVYAGYGNDHVWGGSGNDMILGYGALAGKDPWRSAQARDSDGRDTLYGGDGHDTLMGGGGDDRLSGGRDNDVLTGGVGADTLTGGSGQDVFRFGGTNSQAKLPVYDTTGDVVTDFRRGEDKLDLTPFLEPFMTRPAVDFLGSGAFTDATHTQVRAAVEGGQTVVEIYVPFFNGIGAPEGPSASFTLSGVHQLVKSDFILA
ncbi:calcium-binding protein [Belnapia moabensis]|uniref:calcium-binding protein n=1 Tax=Belnapia moabensis TaxID=365533 RepID=UPI00069346C9|nr:calcium-binding protein [Belnapia moabensis]